MHTSGSFVAVADCDCDGSDDSDYPKKTTIGRLVRGGTIDLNV